MQEVKIRCKKCGKKLLTYSQGSFRRYKSPIKTCKKCGTRYVDPRCHEIAIEGIPKDTFSILSYVIMLIIGLLIGYRGIHLFGMRQLGMPQNTQWLLPVVFMIGGIIMAFGGIVEIIAIKTGIKARKFEKLKRESELRLRDKNYAYMMQNLGYQVPEEFL